MQANISNLKAKGTKTSRKTKEKERLPANSHCHSECSVSNQVQVK